MAGRVLRKNEMGVKGGDMGGKLVLQRDLNGMLGAVGQAFQPAMWIGPKGRLESLPYKSRPSKETSL